MTFAERMLVHTEAPVKVVQQTVRVNVPVVQRVSQPPRCRSRRTAATTTRSSRASSVTRARHELAFTVAADGTVSGIKIAKSSGYDGLDDAAKALRAQMALPPRDQGQCARRCADDGEGELESRRANSGRNRTRRRNNAIAASGAASSAP